MPLNHPLRPCNLKPSSLTQLENRDPQNTCFRTQEKRVNPGKSDHGLGRPGGQSTPPPPSSRHFPMSISPISTAQDLQNHCRHCQAREPSRQRRPPPATRAKVPLGHPSLSQLPPPPTTTSWPRPTPPKPPHIQQKPLPFNPRQSRERPPLKEATKTQEASTKMQEASKNAPTTPPPPPPPPPPSSNPNFHLSYIIYPVSQAHRRKGQPPEARAHATNGENGLSHFISKFLIHLYVTSLTDEPCLS
jgi:hypothetical protein